MQDRAMGAANGLEKQSWDAETHAMERNLLSTFLVSLGVREGVLQVLLEDEVLIKKKKKVFHLVIGAVLNQEKSEW